MEFSVKNNNNNNNKNNNNNNLTDIPLGEQLTRESLTPAKVFERNVSTLRLGLMKALVLGLKRCSQKLLLESVILVSIVYPAGCPLNR